MKNPKDILTKEGMAKLNAGLYNTEEFVFFLSNHLGDLGIGEFDSEEDEEFGAFIGLFDKIKDRLEKAMEI